VGRIFYGFLLQYHLYKKIPMFLLCCLYSLFVSGADTTKPTGKDVIEIPSGEVITCIFDEQPYFPGGERVLVSYLTKNLKYPAAAIKAKVSGSVFVQFLIDTTGTIRNAHTIGTFKGAGLEEEALRVVNGMPKWKRSKTCTQQPVMYNLPIRFVLPGKK
jgi:TonB family protein